MLEEISFRYTKLIIKKRGIFGFIGKVVQVHNRTWVYHSFVLCVHDQNIYQGIYNTNQQLIVSFDINLQVIFHQYSQKHVPN